MPGERGPRLLLLDNHDSFTWNLAHGFEMLAARVEVVATDATTPEAVLAAGHDGIVISPGPGGPAEAGISVELVRAAAAARLPLLGVCLGHQAIALALGGRIVPAVRLMHGKTSLVTHDGRGLFRGLPRPFEATRYHSLAVDPALPAGLEPTAWAEDGTLMGLRHRELPLAGVQFHPESVLTLAGQALLANFVGAVDEQRIDDAA